MVPARDLGVTIVVLALATAQLQAQERSCQPAGGRVLRSCEVDRPPVPAPDRALPQYPPILGEAGVAGEIRVRYLIDSTGRAVPSSISMLHSTHDLLTAAVKRALGSWTFAPAVHGGRPVAVLYDEVFKFEVTREAPPLVEAAVSRDTTAEGVPRTILGRRDADRSAADFWSTADREEAQRHALTSLAEKVPLRDDGQPRVMCVRMLRDSVPAPADPATLERLTTTGRRAVAEGPDCPRTYASMIAMVDSNGRIIERGPPGWVDPHHVSVSLIVPWSRDVLLVEGAVTWGLGGIRYRCGVRRDGSDWRTACRVLYSYVH